MRLWDAGRMGTGAVEDAAEAATDMFGWGGGVERLAGSGGRVWAGGWKWARRGEYLAGTRDAKNEGLVANRPARKGRGQTARDEDACSGASYILYLCTVSPLLGVNEVCPPPSGVQSIQSAGVLTGAASPKIARQTLARWIPEGLPTNQTSTTVRLSLRVRARPELTSV